MQGSVRIEKYTGTEEPFRPPEKPKVIKAVLKPIAPPTPEKPPSLPLAPEPAKIHAVVPRAKVEKRSIILDIETTAVEPFEGRIFCIGFIDLTEPEPEPKVWINENEIELVTDFLNYFRQKQINEIIGYNVIFDYRWIWAKMLAFRIKCPEWYEASLRDLMQILTQVKEKFVYAPPKRQKLETWSKYLLNQKKAVPLVEVLKAWRKRDFKTIEKYNLQDLKIEYSLWNLIEYCRTVEEKIEPLKVEEETITEEGEKEVQCPFCLALNRVPRSAKVWTCEICGRSFPVS
ncbi:MAG: ribonuclease H-like domain-containing protein [Candidatus Baldrarchaeota archaeon]